MRLTESWRPALSSVKLWVATGHCYCLRIHHIGNSLVIGFLFLNSQFLVFSSDSLYLSGLSGKAADLHRGGKQEASSLLEPGLLPSLFGLGEVEIRRCINTALNLWQFKQIQPAHEHG